MTTNVRAVAAQVVARVLGGASLDDALAAAEPAAGADASLLRALAYGVLRDHRLLAALVDAMVERPLPDAPELRALLRVGVFQLRSLRVPPHAAISETVNAVEALKLDWARSLVNALLRRYQRERDALEAGVPQDEAIRLSYPAWLAAAIHKDWGAATANVLAAGNQRAPLTLRVNRRRSTVDECAAQLAAAGMKTQRVTAAPDALVLEQAVPVEQIPGFVEGAMSVQDASAQLAVELLDAQPGARVLDACAAPGGKAAHALERSHCQLVALDMDETRLARVAQTLARLGLRAELRSGDARKPSAWWDGQPFDRILVDAPCSGTGVIRRHPDIKWLRRVDDIPRMAGVQLDLLRALWPLLSAGGALLYSVCSILKAEGDGVIAAFLKDHADAAARPIGIGWGEATAHGRRLAPGGEFDGFYYARLEKRA